MSDITGRDNHIIGQALVYASEWLRSPDDHRDEPSNRRDMEAILATMNPRFVDLHRWYAQCNLTNRTFSNAAEMTADFNAALDASDTEMREVNIAGAFTEEVL